MVHPEIYRLNKLRVIKMANDLFSLIIIDKFSIDNNDYRDVNQAKQNPASADPPGRLLLQKWRRADDC